MFLVRNLVLWSLVHLILVWRARGVPPLRGLSRAWGLGIPVVLWLTYPTARLLERSGPRPLFAAIEAVGTTWLGVLFFCVLALLAAELAIGVARLVRRRPTALRGWALAAGLGLAAVAAVQAARAPVVSDHEITIPGLPAEADGLVIVALTDVHLGATRGDRWLRTLVDEVSALRPDLILLGGDVLDGRGEAEHRPEIATALARLSAPLGVWSVLGNHELKTEAASVRLLEASRTTLLRDAWHEVRPGLILAGAEDPGPGRSSDGHVAPHIARALDGRPPGVATILLCHRPRAAQVAARAGVDLMISGHTHGGQMWPLSLVAGYVHPLLAGRYAVGDMPVVVSRGVGTLGPRMRLWRRGEIVRITLRAPRAGRADLGRTPAADPAARHSRGARGRRRATLRAAARGRGAPRPSSACRGSSASRA